MKCDRLHAAAFVLYPVCSMEGQLRGLSRTPHHGAFLQASSISSMTIYLAMQKLASETIGPKEAETGSSSVTLREPVHTVT